MLPTTLLCLLTVALAQQKQQLFLNSLTTFTPLPNPPIFGIPPSSGEGGVSISVALCSVSSQQIRVFVTNDSTISVPTSSDLDGGDVFEIVLGETGQGSWTGLFNLGGSLAFENAGSTLAVEIGVSDSGDPPLHSTLPETPLLGDTTSTQALFFSAPFAPAPVLDVAYPNYTLPAANASLPSPPQSSPNFSFVLSPTEPQSLRTACFLRTQNSTATGKVLKEGLWLRDEQGWRNQWIVDGLAPSTNYTLFVIEDNTKVSGPIYLGTKSATFACTLTHSLPYCPSISYAIPLPLPSPPSPPYFDSTTIPNTISTPIIESINNFTTSLTTFACGRDEYSPVQTCADCQRAYRRWVCGVGFMRCGEAALSSSSSEQQQQQGGSQTPLPALLPQPPTTPHRNPTFPPMTQGYTLLLPCIETCHLVDRACPSFLSFRCPSVQFGAARSYGVGYVDDVQGDEGSEGKGRTGVSMDGWGNFWCNG